MLLARLRPRVVLPSCGTRALSSTASRDLPDFSGLVHVVNWYPGHMAKAMRLLRTQLSRVQIVLEVRDARAPFASRNREFESLLTTHRLHRRLTRVLVFNKVDLISPREREKLRNYVRWATTEQQRHPQSQPVLSGGSPEGEPGQDVGAVDPAYLLGKSVHPEAVLFSTTSKRSLRELHRVLRTVSADHAARRSSATRFKTVPTMVQVIGFPNVGKSSLINALRLHTLKKGKSKGGARTGGVPGVTRNMSSFLVSEDPFISMFDSPGIMVPNFGQRGSREALVRGLTVGLTGGIRDHLIGLEGLASFLLYSLNSHRQFRYVKEFGLDGPTDSLAELLTAVQRKIGQRRDAHEIERATSHLLRQYREGHLGRFILDDFPPQFVQ